MKTVVGFYGEDYNTTGWKVAFQEHGLELLPWPDWDEDVEIALLWQPPATLFQQNPQLKLLISMGAGVDHLLRLGSALPDLPIVRMADPGLVEFMCNYVVMAVLYHHRNMNDYRILQNQERWQPLDAVFAKNRSVGFLGLGNMALPPAKVLTDLGHPVLSWTRTAKNVPNVESFFGTSQLDEFLTRSDILVSVLPATQETDGLLNRSRLAKLPEGAAVINVGRGNVLVLDDLLELLESKHLSGATLDVFQQEPLQQHHPAWRNPRLQITPHIASPSLPASVAVYVSQVLECYQQGRPLKNTVDCLRGY